MKGRAARAACIAGVGESPYARRSGMPLAHLQHLAIDAAVTDAGIAPSEIGAIMSESLAMPRLLSTDKVVAMERLDGVRQASYHSGYGAGIGQAVVAACTAIESGAVDVALVYFGTDFGSRAGGVYQLHGAHAYKRDLEFPHGFVGQPVYFALFARRYAHEYGVPEEELRTALCEIAVRANEHGRRHANAIVRRPLDRDEYFADTHPVADPLGVYDCSVLSDGAAAIVLTTVDRAERPVRLVGSGYGQSLLDESSVFTQNTEIPRLPFVRDSADRAFAEAGVARDDVDVALIYDCFTISLLLQLEEMGFCEPGDGPAFVRDGTISTTGRLPLNPHGGLLSQAYVMGINHLVEGVRQVRGDAGATQVQGAELAAVGLLSAREHATLILQGGR